MNDIQKISLDGLAEIKSDFVGPDDVARIVGVSLATVRRWLQAMDQNGLPHTKLGGSIRIHRSSLVDFLNATAQGALFEDPGYVKPIPAAREHPGTLTDPDPASKDPLWGDDDEDMGHPGTLEDPDPNNDEMKYEA